jgi:hypothetical protein
MLAITTNMLDTAVSPVICVVHNKYSDYPMHLSYKTAKYKDTIYKSYFLAESYREGGKVKSGSSGPLAD